MSKMYIIFLFLLLLYSHSFGQSTTGLIRYKGTETEVQIGKHGLSFLTTKYQDGLAANDQYQIAWSLGALSEVYMFLNDHANAKQYYTRASVEIKKLNPNSIYSCVLDIESLTGSLYSELPNGFDLSIVIHYLDLAVTILPNTTSVQMEKELIFLLINSAAYSWKYNLKKALTYFEEIKVVATPILERSMLNPGEGNLEMVKDPLRRYLRFMYNLHFSSNTELNKLCVNNECLEKAWEISQLIKSRNFKSKLFKVELQKLKTESYNDAVKYITYLDSTYYSPQFYKDIIINHFKMGFNAAYKADSVANMIKNLLPVFKFLIADSITLSSIKASLKANETYISLMYTDNERNVYVWKIEHESLPKLLKLDIKSLDFFLRVEYFRNTKISRESFIKIQTESKTLNIPLEVYIKWKSKFASIECDTFLNEKALYKKVIVPLKLLRNNKVIVEIDQNLGSFPIGLVKDSFTHRYLFQDYSLTYTPSASIFNYLRNKKISNEKLTYDYIGYSYEDGADQFVDSIINLSASMFNSSKKCFFHSSESLIYSTDSFVQRSKILHFACHNDIRTKDFCLIFGKDKINDGKLTGEEIVNKVINNAEIVVLTSCSTAPYLDDYDFVSGYLDEYKRLTISESCICSIGETFSNITSAFFAAGARKMLVTQWEIPDDESSAIFISEFFRLMNRGYSPDNALRMSQEKFMDQLEPIYWGGYILVGE